MLQSPIPSGQLCTPPGQPRAAEHPDRHAACDTGFKSAVRNALGLQGASAPWLVIAGAGEGSPHSMLWMFPTSLQENGVKLRGLCSPHQQLQQWWLFLGRI